MALPVSITFLILIPYVLVMGFLFLGLLCLRRPQEKVPSGKGKVAVVVPFRNEAAHLPGLINDMARQSCSGERFCVILVNDHSTDGSYQIATSLVEKHDNFSCLDLPEGMRGKKDAISHAISSAETDWILQTDADCRVGTAFISSHLSFLEDHPSELVAGLVTTENRGGGFLEAFQRLDMFGLTGAGAGSYPYGRPLMCSGANLLYSRSLYMDTRTFDPADKTASGDDMFLLIGARKLKRKISFNPDERALVSTSPVKGPGALLRQRMRWGGKSVYYGMGDIQILAVLVALASFGLLFSLVWMILEPSSTVWLIPAAGMKLLADFLILAAVSKKAGQESTLWWFLPVWIVYAFYMPVVIVGSLFRGASWKGRTLR